MNAPAMNVSDFAEPRAPVYAWGQRVVALDDLVNDGSHPERELSLIHISEPTRPY